MRLPRRGVLVRLFIYVPLIGFLGWRAYESRCGEPDTVQPEPEASVEDRLAPHRRVITLPDGTQQEIVELTPEEAEAILGRPLPQHMKDDAEADRRPDAADTAPPERAAAVGQADGAAGPAAAD